MISNIAEWLYCHIYYNEWIPLLVLLIIDTIIYTTSFWYIYNFSNDSAYDNPKCPKCLISVRMRLIIVEDDIRNGVFLVCSWRLLKAYWFTLLGTICLRGVAALCCNDRIPIITAQLGTDFTENAIYTKLTRTWSDFGFGLLRLDKTEMLDPALAFMGVGLLVTIVAYILFTLLWRFFMPLLQILFRNKREENCK